MVAVHLNEAYSMLGDKIGNVSTKLEKSFVKDTLQTTEISTCI